MALALLSPGDHRSVRPAKTRLRDRLEARIEGGCVDRLLARGVAPDSDAALQRRARRLVGAPMRRRLADRLEWTTREALAGSGHRSGRVVADRRAVADAAEELDTIVARLRGPEPVGATGVARVVGLLADGTGPLYVRDAEPELATAAEAAIAGLDAVAG